MMSSRDVVCATIECRGPNRLLYCIDVDRPLFEERFTAEQMAVIGRHVARQPSDFIGIGFHREPTYLDAFDEHGGRHFVDEWGNEWTGTMPRVVGHPLEAGWEKLDTYTPPGPPGAALVEGARRVAEKARAEHKYVRGSVSCTLFERLWFLRGFENMLMDPHLYPREFERLREIVVEDGLAKIRALGEIGVDGIFFSDDWGTQEGLIISPDDWRRFYKPAYARLFGAARDVADHVWMHQCGNVAALVGEFVDLGLNVLHPIQSRALDVEALGRDWRGKLCFYGGIDVQRTLPFGTPDDVWREIGWLIETLSAPTGGGYIGGTSHTIGPETPFGNIIAAFECLEEHAGISRG